MSRGDHGFNARISARGAGSRRIRVISLDFGLGIIASSDNEARNRRAFYPVVTTGSSFTMTLGFVSWGERERFNTWMHAFMEGVANGGSKYGTMTVRAPSHDFTRVAVPETDIEYGEGVKDVAYTMAVGFIGATDPVNLTLSQRMSGVSFFQGPKSDQESRYFYPQGRQIAGAESLDGTIFDSNPVGVGYGGGGFSTETADDRLDRFDQGATGV